MGRGECPTPFPKCRVVFTIARHWLNSLHKPLQTAALFSVAGESGQFHNSAPPFHAVSRLPTAIESIKIVAHCLLNAYRG